MALTKSGFCMYESLGSHSQCTGYKCDCECHEDRKQFKGRGIIFAVVDTNEVKRSGIYTTVEAITEAIEAALDNGKETSEEIAKYLTTGAFKHIADRTLRFNSLLKAGDATGAQIVKKLYTAYDELCETAAKAKTPKEKAELQVEARGFATAVQIMLSPFAVEYEGEPTLVDWDKVDELTAIFEKDREMIRSQKQKWKPLEGQK